MSSVQPTVSVSLLTYNHERYLGQALDGVLAQQTTFPIEVVVGEDCSTDRTRDVVDAYAGRFPGVIRPVRRERNVGMMANFLDVFAQCRGRYVALLEGDDVWTDRRKLQRQFEALEADRACTVCFHNVRVFHEDAAVPDRLSNPPWQPARSTLRDLVAGNFMETCSVMYRRDAVAELPAWWATLAVGDWPTHLLFAEQGAIAYLPEVMGAYRVHGGGVWSLSSLARRCRANIDVAERMNALFHCAYDAEFTRTRLSLALTIERHAPTPEERREAGREVDALLKRLRGRRPAGVRAALEIRGGRAGFLAFRAADRVRRSAADALQRGVVGAGAGRP